MANPYQRAIDAATAQAMQESPEIKGLEKNEASSTQTVQGWLGQPTDGQWTSETDKALQKKLLEYQERKGLPGTGSLDFETLRTMRQDSLDNPEKSDPSPDVVKALGDLQRLDIHRRNEADFSGKPYEGNMGSLEKPPVPEAQEPPVQEAPEQSVGSTMSPPEKKEGGSFSNSVDPGGGINLGSDKNGNPTVRPSKAFMEAANALPGEPAVSSPSPSPQPPAPTPQLDLPPGP